jgi:hypothetical protein
VDGFFRAKVIKRLIKYRTIDHKTKCWNWTKTINSKGYAVTHILGRIRMVARLSAVIFMNLELDDDISVLHKCDNKVCFNPDHLILKNSKK